MVSRYALEMMINARTLPAFFAGASAIVCVGLGFDDKAFKELKALIMRFLTSSLKNRGLGGKTLNKLKALTHNMHAQMFRAIEYWSFGVTVKGEG